MNASQLPFHPALRLQPAVGVFMGTVNVVVLLSSASCLASHPQVERCSVSAFHSDASLYQRGKQKVFADRFVL